MFPADSNVRELGVMENAKEKVTRVCKKRRHLCNRSHSRKPDWFAVRNRQIGDGPYPPSTKVGVASLIYLELLIKIEVVAAFDRMA